CNESNPLESPGDRRGLPPRQEHQRRSQARFPGHGPHADRNRSARGPATDVVAQRIAHPRRLLPSPRPRSAPSPPVMNSSAPSMPGRTVVITGASTGVGRATAHRFARSGARIGLISRDERALNDVKSEVEALGSTAAVAALDVAEAPAVFDAADRFADLL